MDNKQLAEATRLGTYKAFRTGRGIALTIPTEYLETFDILEHSRFETFMFENGDLYFRRTT